MNHSKNVVIFGGSGFIGAHFSIYLLEHNLAEQIFLLDVERPKFENLPPKFEQFSKDKKIKFIALDVRQSIPVKNQFDEPVDSYAEELSTDLPTQVDLIVNLAAVHREPGHEKFEYYDTNIPGAENICNWARAINCTNIIFTSSIAVYGTEKVGPKTEESVPEPNTPYGVSKLAAEHIHEDWVKESSDRKLLIVRPGVIFGTGEAGNITRLIHGIRNRYFVFLGNQNVVKSGGYVKELCSSIVWMMNYQAQQNLPEVIYNFTMNPAATMAQYAQAIVEALGVKQKIRNIPFGLLLPLAKIIGIISSWFKIDSPINAARVEKLLRENNIIAKKLMESGYKYEYTLDSALLDWKQEHPQDWGLN
jgi:nucleoside-diphosphate-sugar epimerase